ncbi:type II secretion system major pseudopilin GspG [Blastopirellula sp. JC732]|uniref:Type II secretion system core protein G n=1 Tax=Blastopirellula sediminis TaxID=2894196 RepID=A0A9X1MIV5_9BACT|nr:type II secretion system major pseudopilin GspG [Blastopirellula sediminis]MCC9608222.1 type II secretion system major pseudopilin GspG [Blastopirellula sediminis]MCC9626985.1 type II secretion system major pseudopilin GspG [Blastopirellula sediminis]
MSQQRNRRRRRGFTLLEVLLVLVILVILASFAGVAIFRAYDQAKGDSVKVQVEMLNQACKQYMLNVGQPPQALQDLVSAPAGSTKWKGPYLEKALPEDAWGNQFKYEVVNGMPRVFSAGPDGVEGTDDDVPTKES